MIGPRRNDEPVLSALTGIMVGCLVLSTVTLLERFISTWHPSYLPVFCGLAAAEAAFSWYRWGKLPDLRLRLLELSTLLVLRQMWADVAEGRAPIQAGAPSFDPRQAGLFALASSLVFLSWLVATQITRDFHQLGESPGLYGPDLSSTRGLATRFLTGGILLVVLAGISRAPIAALLGIPRGNAPTLNVLVYFLAGIGLLALAQRRLQDRRREHNEIAYEGDFSRMWLRRSLASIALVTALALGLPSEHTYGVVGLGGQAMAVLARLFPHGNVAQNPASQPGVVDTPISHGPGPKRSEAPAGKVSSSSAGPWDVWGIDLSTLMGFMLFAVKFLLLWLAVLGSIGYRVYAMRRRRRYHVPPSAGASGFLEGVRAFLAALRHLFQPATPISSVHTPRDEASQPPRASARRPRRLRLRTLTPREQIVRWYVDMAGQAKRRHLRRRHSQTPHEYTAFLAPRLDANRDDVQAVTDEFVRARYSPRDVTRERVTRLRPSWRQARSAVRRLE